MLSGPFKTNFSVMDVESVLSHLAIKTAPGPFLKLSFLAGKKHLSLNRFDVLVKTWLVALFRVFSIEWSAFMA